MESILGAGAGAGAGSKEQGCDGRRRKEERKREGGGRKGTKGESQ